jgi:hypothetical protein
MRRRWSSERKREYSLPAPILRTSEVEIPQSGLDMPAWNAGFWRRIAANSEDPDRGNPEMN